MTEPIKPSTYFNITQTFQAFQKTAVVPTFSNKSFLGYESLREKPLVFLHYYLLRFIHFVIESVHVITPGKTAFQERTATANSFLEQLDTINKVRDVISAYFTKLKSDEIAEGRDEIQKAQRYLKPVKDTDIASAQDKLGKILGSVDETKFATFKELLVELQGISDWLSWHEKLDMPVPLGSIEAFLNGGNPSKKLIEWYQALNGTENLDVFEFYKFLLLALTKLGKEEKEIEKLAGLIKKRAPSILGKSSPEYKAALKEALKLEAINDGHNSIEKDGHIFVFDSRNPFMIFTNSSTESCGYFPKVALENPQLGIVTTKKVEGKPLDETQLLAFLRTEKTQDCWFEGLTKEMIVQDGKTIKFTCPRTITSFDLEPVSDFVRSTFAKPSSVLLPLGFNSRHPRVIQYLGILKAPSTVSIDPRLEKFRQDANHLLKDTSSTLKEKYSSTFDLPGLLESWMDENRCYHKVPSQEEFILYVAKESKAKLKDTSSIGLSDSDKKTLAAFTKRMNALGMFNLAQIDEFYYS